MSDLLIDYSYLRTFALTDQNLTLVIDFETMNDVSKYINQLEYSLFFTDVQIRTITTFEPTDTESTDIFTMVPRYETTIDL